MAGTYFLRLDPVTSTDLSLYAPLNRPSFTGTVSVKDVVQLADGRSGQPALSFTADADTGIAHLATDSLSLVGGGVEVMRAAALPGAVNGVRLDAAPTGFSPIFTATGSDSHIGFNFNAKNSGGFAFNATGTQFVIQPTASSVNYLAITGAGTGTAPTLSVRGNDADVDIALLPKGTGGRLRFGNFTAGGASTVTGYIEIRDASGTIRKLAVVG